MTGLWIFGKVIRIVIRLLLLPVRLILALLSVMVAFAGGILSKIAGLIGLMGVLAAIVGMGGALEPREALFLFIGSALVGCLPAVLVGLGTGILGRIGSLLARI